MIAEPRRVLVLLTDFVYRVDLSSTLPTAAWWKLSRFLYPVEYYGVLDLPCGEAQPPPSPSYKRLVTTSTFKILS